MDDAKRAITMDMCPVELEKHVLLISERFDRYPKSQGRRQGLLAAGVSSVRTDGDR